MSFPRALAAALALLPAIGTAAFAQPMPDGTQTMPRPTPDADALAAAMRRLGTNPRDLDALITAGELSLKLGDAGGAASLFKRAEQLSPLNGRVRAGMARILVTQERPGEALRYFDQAIGFGLDPRSFAGDRGLAYDLIGEQERAQRDYRAALRDADDPEVRRRYALSLGIAGRREEALRQIEPLLRTSDRGAWRARAFILAMAGDVAGAEQVAGQTMPPAMVAAIRPFLALLVRMAPADRAFAVHFGEVRMTAARIADAQLTPPLPALGPDPDARTVQVAAAPPPMSRAERARQRRAERAQARQAARERLASRERPAPVRARPAAEERETDRDRERTRLAALDRRRAMTPPGSMVASPPPAARPPATPGFGELTPSPAPTPSPTSAPSPAASVAPPVAVAAAPAGDPRPAPAPPAVLPPAPAPAPSPSPPLPPSPPAQSATPSPSPQLALAPPPPPAVTSPPTGVTPAVPTPAPAPTADAVGSGEVAGPPAAEALRAATDAPQAVAAAPAPLPRGVAGPPVPADLRAAPSPERPSAPPPAPPPAPPSAPSSAPPSSGSAQAVAGPPAPVAAPPATIQPLPPAAGSSAVAATPTASPTRDREVLARIIAGIVIPGAELGVAPPPTREAAAPIADVPAPAPVPDAEAVRRETAARRAEEARAAAAKKAADARAAAAKRVAEEKAAVARKAAEERAAERKAARAEPARHWVQVAGGANQADLAKAWAAVRARSSLLAGRAAFSTPLRATNRVVTGPFKTEAEAQDFVNRLAKQGVSAFTFASAPGQKMTRLGTQ